MKDQLFSLSIGGEPLEIKMTFGLLNELCKIAGDADAALMFNIQAELREEALVAMLSERDDKGRVTTSPNLFYLDADPEEINGLLDWAGAHVLDFFLTSAERAKASGTARKARLEALQST